MVNLLVGYPLRGVLVVYTELGPAGSMTLNCTSHGLEETNHDSPELRPLLSRFYMANTEFRAQAATHSSP